MDTQTLFAVLNLIGAPTVIGYLAVQIIRKYRGRQVRADHDAITNSANALRVVRQEDYIEVLRSKITDLGHEPPPWPRGLSPIKRKD